MQERYCIGVGRHSCDVDEIYVFPTLCAVDEVERVHHNTIRANASLSYYKYNKVMNGGTITNNSTDNINDDENDDVKKPSKH